MPRGGQRPPSESFRSIASGAAWPIPMIYLESRFERRGRNKKGMRPDKMTDNAAAAAAVAVSQLATST